MLKMIFVVIMSSLFAPSFSQTFPGSYSVNPSAISERGSSATGHCSNVSDSGRVCNTPRSSVLFDGIIPTLTGLDGDMWATQLLTLDTSTLSANITFDFNTVFDTNGVTTYTGVELIEIVMFNCLSTGANSIQVLGDNNDIGTITIEQSCSSLVRGCNMELSTTARIISLVFDTSLQPYIAEISIYTNSARQCTMPIGELPDTVENFSTLVDPMTTNFDASATDHLTTDDDALNINNSVMISTTVNATPNLSTQNETCVTNKDRAAELDVVSQLAAASVTSFIVGNLTGAIGGILILRLIYCITNKAHVKSTHKKCNNTTNQVLYEEINISKEMKSVHDVELQSNSAYGQLN